MKRLLKIAAIVLGSLVGLLVLVVVVVTLVVDPNDYKDNITAAVKNATGRTLHMPGKLKLSYFPWIGLETGVLELSNAPGFGKAPFARVKSADVKVALLPLFRGQIEAGTVRLDGLELNLEKAPSGKTNWDDLMAAKAEPATAPATKPGARPTSGPAVAALAIGGIDIRKAQLRWNDRTTGEHLALRDFNLRTGRLAVGQPVALHLDVELQQDKPARRIPVRLDTQLTATEEDLALRKLDLRLDDSRVTGSVSLAFNQPVYRFDLSLDQIDVDRYLAPAESKPTTAKAPAEKQPVAIPMSLLRALNTQGELKIGKLKAMGIRSADILVRINARDGLIALGPNSAKLYSGTYSGTTKLDVRGKEPRFHFKESLAGIAVGPFLRDAQLFANFDGTGNIALDLTAQGFDDRAITSTLGGKVQIDFRKGQIVGIDLIKTISETKARFDQARGKSVRAKPPRDAVTAYDSLTATVSVERGLASNTDLSLVSPQLRATGKGTANLVTEQMDYRLKNRVTRDTKLRDIDVPVRVHGPFTDLAYDVEWDTIAKQLFKEKSEEKLKRKLRERLLR